MKRYVNVIAAACLTLAASAVQAQNSQTFTITPAGGTITYNAPAGPVRMVIPSGSFNSTTQITIRTPAANAFPNPSYSTMHISSTGIGISVTVSPSISSNKEITVTMEYRPGDLANYNPDRILMSRYDCEGGTWVPLVSMLDQNTRQLTGTTTRLNCYLQMVQIRTEQVLSGAQIFPNPFRPAQGQSRVLFSSIPPGSTVTLFTLTGEKLLQVSANSSGVASWDGRNGSGANVASGVYFALIEANGTKQTLKVAVQR